MKKRLLLALVVLMGLFLLSASIVCAHGMGDQDQHHDQHQDPDHDHDQHQDQHQHHTDLENYDLRVWDCSGFYTETRDNMTLSFTLIQDAKGKLKGSGTLDYSSDENDISIPVEIKGKVKGKNNIVTLKYKVEGKGPGYVSGEDTDVKLKDKVSLELDKSSLSLMGTMKRKLCAKGSGCEADTSHVSLEVPDGMTGNAVLSIDVEPNKKGKNLKGTAELTLSNDDEYPLYAKGKYNSKKDETQYQLKGVVDSTKGIKFKLKIDEESDAATFISGKALGQQLKYKLE